MRRRLVALVITCAVAPALACSTAPSGRDAARELALAARAEEQLTSDFADSVADAEGLARTATASQQAAARTEVVDPCPGPMVDESAFRDFSLDPLPVTISAPSTYRLSQRDTIAASLASGADQLRFQRSTSGASLDDSGAWDVTSHCDDMIGGAHVHLDAASRRGSPLERGLSASFQLPTGAYLVVTGELHDAQALAAALHAVRTIQFRYYWNP